MDHLLNTIKLFCLEFVSTIFFILITSFGLVYLQNVIFCSQDISCLFWGELRGFILINCIFGWVICYYFFAIIRKRKLSRLIKFTIPIFIILYIFSGYYLFGSYSKVENNTLTSRENSLTSETTINISDIDNISFTQSSWGEGGNHVTWYVELIDGRVIYIRDDVAKFLIEK